MFRSPFAISPAVSSQVSGSVTTATDQSVNSRPSLADRLSVNQLTTLPWEFDRDLAEYEAAGIRAVGLVVDKIDLFGRAAAVQQFRQSRLEASSLNWIAGFTGANGYSLQDAISEGEQTLQLAHDLGVPNVVVIAGPRNNHTWRHADQILIDSLTELGDSAAGFGVNLALMPMGPSYRQSWSYLRSLRDAARVVRRIDSSYVGLAVHTAHVFRERGLPSLLAETGDLVKLVRLGDCCGRPQHDNDQRWLGEGIVPVTAIAAALDDAGYDGYYEIDVWSREIWSEGTFAPYLETLPDLTFGAPPPPVPMHV